MTDYKHKSITKLSLLFAEHKEEMGEGFGLMAMLWKAISPSIPALFSALDEDEEMLMKIKNFLTGITDAMREDTEKAIEATEELKDKGEKNESTKDK